MIVVFDANISYQLLSHPSLGWLLCFQFFFAAAAVTTMILQPFKLNLRYLGQFKLNLRYLGQGKYRSGNMYWMTFLWPWPKVTAVALMNKNLLLCKIKSESLHQSLQNLVAISLWSCHAYYLIRFWRNFVGNFFLQNFLWNVWMCFFKVKHSIGHISGMVCPIDVKRKGGALVGCWVNYVTLTFYLTCDLDIWFFKVKIQNSSISGILVWLIWNKKKANLHSDCIATGVTSDVGMPSTDLIPYYYNRITVKFCMCHSCYAAMTCAKNL